jgi:hypothetical protein
MNIQREARAQLCSIYRLLLVDSDDKFMSDGAEVYGDGKKMADVLNCYDAR